MSRRCSLLALLVLALLVPLAIPAFGAESRAALERSYESAMKSGRWHDAGRAAHGLVRLREAAGTLSLEQAGTLCDSLGRRLFMAGSPDAWAVAEKLFRDGLARRERAFGPDDPRVASNLATVSTLLDYLGRWGEAVPLAERAVAIRARALGETNPETASSLRQLGLLRFQLGDYAGAEDPLSRSLAIYAGLPDGDAGKIADGCNNLGELARVRDQLDSAEAHFRRGFKVAGAGLAIDSPIRLALANNLAGLFKDVGRLDEAEPLLENALTMIEATGGDPEALATAHLNLAEVRRLQDRPAEASGLYALALHGARIALGAGHPGLVLFLNQAAVCEQQLGHYARADSLFRETGAILETALGPDHPLLAQHLHDLARLRLDAGRPREADSLLARALAIRERSLGARHPDLALVLVDQARARAREGGDPDAPAAPLARAIALLDSSSAYPDARLEAYAQRAEWHAGRGRTEAAITDMTVALAAMDSLRTWRGGGDETRAAFLASRQGMLDEMVGWQLERGNAAAALATHERGRARVLLDQIAGSGVDLRAGIPPEVLQPLIAAERTAEARLAAAHRAFEWTRSDPALAPRERLEQAAAFAARGDSAARDLATARRRIQDASPVWRAVLGADGGIPGIPELQRDVVPHDGLLLVYHVGTNASHVFLVPPRGPVESYPLSLDADAANALGEPAGGVGDAALERIVTGRPAATGRDASPGIVTLLGGAAIGGFLSLPLRSSAGPDSFELRLHALCRTLVPEPLRQRLRAARVAAVVPDGALQLVAFEALVTRPRGRSGSTRYWLDDWPALVYGPSATSLRGLARRPRAAEVADLAPVLSVSDVAYARRDARTGGDIAATAGTAPDRRSWPPLPGTVLETQAIRTAFGNARVETLSGAAAREPAVRAALAGRRYVHLATHGFADLSQGSVRAGLVLAPPLAADTGNEDDGVLELFEIHRLPLACDLAVLSACETARGPRVAGEGSFALSRAFLAAGARQVVASLWAVSDRTGAVVVGGLFEAVARADARGRRVEVALALRDAKRRVRDDPRWSDPFYWAPFVLSGE